MSELIYAYTRAQAIADGVLIDVSERAKRRGIAIPTACTLALWEKFIASASADESEQECRVDYVLLILKYAMGRCSKPLFLFEVSFSGDAAKTRTLKYVCGPGDDGEHVITLMLPRED